MNRRRTHRTLGADLLDANNQATTRRNNDPPAADAADNMGMVKKITRLADQSGA